MKLKPDMSETSHRSSKVLTPSLEVIPGGKGKATMSGGGSTGRGKSQPKTDPKYHFDYLLSNYSVDSLLKVC